MKSSAVTVTKSVREAIEPDDDLHFRQISPPPFKVMLKRDRQVASIEAARGIHETQALHPQPPPQVIVWT